MAQPIVKDIEHAEEILRDTVEATWDSTIKQSEPQVIVASAMVAFHYKEQIAEVKGELESAMDRIDQLESRP